MDDKELFFGLLEDITGEDYGVFENLTVADPRIAQAHTPWDAIVALKG
jgi:hypothetical protein